MALISAPALKTFDPELSRHVLADTSGFAISTILEYQVDGCWHPVEFFFKCLSDVESCWSATECEMLGYMLNLEK